MADETGVLIGANNNGMRKHSVCSEGSLKPVKVYIRHVLTHTEYDRDRWKE